MRKRDNMPEAAYMALRGIKTKKGAYGWMMLSLTTSASFLIYGIVKSEPWSFIFSVGFLFAAVWYYYAIRWIDRNST